MFSFLDLIVSLFFFFLNFLGFHFSYCVFSFWDFEKKDKFILLCVFPFRFFMFVFTVIVIAVLKLFFLSLCSLDFQDFYRFYQLFRHLSLWNKWEKTSKKTIKMILNYRMIIQFECEYSSACRQIYVMYDGIRDERVI